MHFVMKKEFAFPYFNGVLQHVTCGLGANQFLDVDKEVLAFINSKKVKAFIATVPM